jgi:DNA-binding NtrC family response regulator
VFVNSRLALIVEDDPLQREALVDLLLNAGTDVIGCDSAAAGELIVSRVGADLSVLITDVILAGGRSGLELIAFARKQLPGLKIIVVSGKPGLTTPADVSLLPKPYSPEQLLRLSTI